jgi:AcrR family transcriptional regulator
VIGTAADLLAGRPLRERKRARIRVGLWQAMCARVEATPFADISVRELAASVEVSEPTFFAHFTSKVELLSYHICLWHLLTVLPADEAGPGMPFLRRFFELTAAGIVQAPRLWFEITAEASRGGGVCEVLDVSPAERLLVCATPAALDVTIQTQAELFAQHLTVARRERQLVGSVPDAVTGLLTGFYGVPLALGPGQLGHLGRAYRAHLDRFLTTARRPR